MTETFDEYAIEVEGVGWLTEIFPYPNVTRDNPAPSFNQEEVLDQASQLARQYTRLGQPDIADKVKVRVRTVTLSRGEWRHNP